MTTDLLTNAMTRAASGEARPAPLVAGASAVGWHETLGRILDAFHDRVLVVDAARVVRYANRAAEADSASVVGSPVEQVLPGYVRLCQASVAVADALGGGEAPVALPASFRRATGRAVPVEVSIEAGIWMGETVEFVVCREVSDRLAMAQENLRLVTAVNHVAESIVITDAAGSIEYVNPAFTLLTGYERDEVLGCNPRMFKSGQHSEEFYREMWRSLGSGQTWSGRIVNRRKNGELYTEDATFSPIVDHEGLITHFVGVKRDVTEELTLASRLRESQKMEAVGTLAGGVAHDFNNILYALLGYVDLALDDLPVGHPSRNSLVEIEKAGQRAAGLVAKMLTFGRRGGGQREAVSLAAIVTEGLELVRASFPANVRIVTDFDGEGCKVKADPAQLQQVLMNFCANSLHAMGAAGGELSISLDRVESDGDEAPDWARLRVADTGCGIAPALLDRVFEPYVSTRAAREGSGLGLASVHGIVTSHGGRVSVRNLSHGGAEFSVLLPLLTSRERDRNHEAGGGPAEARQQARVLVVDDEVMVTQVLERALIRSGFLVRSHADGVAALAEFSADPAAFDAVITDQTMPSISGLELARRVYELRPELPLILTTGYCDEATEERAREAGIRHFMAKPVKLRELIEVLMELTGTAATP